MTVTSYMNQSCLELSIPFKIVDIFYLNTAANNFVL